MFSFTIYIYTCLGVVQKLHLKFIQLHFQTGTYTFDGVLLLLWHVINYSQMIPLVANYSISWEKVQRWWWCIFFCLLVSMNANKYYPQLQCVGCVHYHRQQSIIHGDATLFDCQNEKEHMFEPIFCPCLSGGNDLKAIFVTFF